MSSQADEASYPGIPQVLIPSLHHFVNRANTKGISSTSRKHLYRFIIAAHEANINLEWDDLEQVFLDAGFSPGAATDLMTTYDIGRGLLAEYNAIRDEMRNERSA